MRRTNYRGYQIEYRCGSWCAAKLGLGGFSKLEDLKQEIDVLQDYEAQANETYLLSGEEFTRALEAV